MKRRLSWLAALGWLTGFVVLPSLEAQRRPYIGYTYPAGAQQGTTCQIKLGGQDLDDVHAVLVTGTGVSAHVVKYYRRLNNQEMQLLREQLKLLKPGRAPGQSVAAPTKGAPPDSVSAMVEKIHADAASGEGSNGVSGEEMIAVIERRTREWVQTPACSSISSLVIAEVTIAPDASPGTRELRLVTPRGVSNPLVFQIGQLPEYARPPMLTATLHVLGKEALALRNRPASEVERSIKLPCTVNGQIAAREVNRYRFEATKDQRLVISTQARQLIPYVADAVPGWFQPVVALYDDQGNEVAFADDYRFKPDPVIRYQVPRDGQYVLEIHDSLYRGREDFIYRISIGELPFVTSLFPAGRTVGSAVTPKMTGWNLGSAQPTVASEAARPGIELLAVAANGLSSNFVPFAIDRLADEFDREGNDAIAHAQKIALPLMVNGRIDRADDWDVFQFSGKAGETVVAEVHARRLDSPLDSVIKLTDAAGKVLAFSDDREDLTAGINTHHADSYFMAKLPADGDYFVHLGDTARNGGEEYVYRLRISAPQPDFELRVVPSSISVGVNATAAVSVYAARKDGFSGPIRISLKDPPPGLTAMPVTLSPTQSVARLALRAGLARSEMPLRITIAGSARIGVDEIVHEAVPAEDRMQAFLWRHLVPASELRVMIFDPRYQPPPKRSIPARPEPVAVAVPSSTAATPAVAAESNSTVATATPPAPTKPKFTKQQIAGRLRQLKLLYEEGLLTDGFYSAKVAECEDGP